MSIEETFRCWHSVWGVRVAVVDLPTAAMVERLIGMVCLTYNLQMHIGQRVSTDPVGEQRCRHWTVTDRVSWFWCGQRLFDDPGYDWSDWLAQQWKSLGQSGTNSQATPVSETVLEKTAWRKGGHSPGASPSGGWWCSPKPDGSGRSVLWLPSCASRVKPNCRR